MTTIAYRDGVLAGDTMIVEGDTKLPRAHKKVFRFRDGSLFGGAGAVEDIELVRRSVVKGNMELPELPGESEFSGLLVMPDGSVYETEGRVWSKAKVPYTAIGSGSNFALVAMRMGADARTAVKMACEFDKNSGGRVQQVKLNPTKREAND